MVTQKSHKSQSHHIKPTRDHIITNHTVHYVMHVHQDRSFCIAAKTGTKRGDKPETSCFEGGTSQRRSQSSKLLYISLQQSINSWGVSANECSRLIARPPGPKPSSCEMKQHNTTMSRLWHLRSPNETTTMRDPSPSIP